MLMVLVLLACGICCIRNWIFKNKIINVCELAYIATHAVLVHACMHDIFHSERTAYNEWLELAEFRCSIANEVCHRVPYIIR